MKIGQPRQIPTINGPTWPSSRKQYKRLSSQEFKSGKKMKFVFVGTDDSVISEIKSRGYQTFSGLIPLYLPSLQFRQGYRKRAKQLTKGYFPIKQDQRDQRRRRRKYRRVVSLGTSHVFYVSPGGTVSTEYTHMFPGVTSDATVTDCGIRGHVHEYLVVVSNTDPYECAWVAQQLIRCTLGRNDATVVIPTDHLSSAVA
jgi:hypothetical protein